MSGSTSTPLEIPLIAANQTFGVALSGVQYTFTIIYRDSEVSTGMGEGAIGSFIIGESAIQAGFDFPSTWVLDIDDASGNALVHGIPLVTGIDLLAQYAYIGFVGKLYVQTDGDPFAQPTGTNLGSTSHLYYVPN